jgi:hypothetical protein
VCLTLVVPAVPWVMRVSMVAVSEVVTRIRGVN